MSSGKAINFCGRLKYILGIAELMQNLNTLCPGRVLGTGDWIQAASQQPLTLYPLLRVAPVP
jgi:hypothetical protein